jgi:hypothetical protein
MMDPEEPALDGMNHSPRKKKDVKEVTDKVTNVNPDHLI